MEVLSKWKRTKIILKSHISLKPVNFNFLHVGSQHHSEPQINQGSRNRKRRRKKKTSVYTAWTGSGCVTNYLVFRGPS